MKNYAIICGRDKEYLEHNKDLISNYVSKIIYCNSRNIHNIKRKIKSYDRYYVFDCKSKLTEDLISLAIKNSNDLNYSYYFKNNSMGLYVFHGRKGVKKYKKPIEKINKISERHEVDSKLAVITTFFNPHNFINLRYNYLKFSEKIKEKADLFPIELSFDGNFFIEDENVIQIKGTEENILWQKERLLNIALENLPKEYTNVAWIDCDIIFENENWVDDVNNELQKYKVVQVFNACNRLNKDDKVYKVSHSIVKKTIESGELVNNSIGTPGFAWAIRREVIDKIKFLDINILGGADAVMFRSFFGNIFSAEKKKWCEDAFSEVDSSVNYIPGNITHLYHGDRKNRSYGNRYDILKNNNFSYDEDLYKDENNLWRIKDKKIIEEIKEYFGKRQEDDNILDINTYFDNIYVLNLDRHKERFEKVKNKLDNLGIKFQRFSAIDGNNLDTSKIKFGSSNKGLLENKYAYACLKSHIEIIKDAKKNKYKRILVFEDDVLISKDIHVHFQKLRKIKDWKLLYLGATQYNWNLKFTEDFYYANRTFGCFAYGIDQTIYDLILRKNDNTLSVDSVLHKKIQPMYKSKSYVFYPNICRAGVSTSSIRTERDNEKHGEKIRWNILKNYI